MANGPTNGPTNYVDQAVRVIRDLGFPIVIAAFLLWKLPPQIDKWTDAVRESSTATSRLADTVHDAMQEAAENRANIAAIRTTLEQQNALLRQLAHPEEQP